MEAFSGPIPHPQARREYEAVIPGLAERIVRWTEDEARHRRIIGSLCALFRFPVRCAG